jgi:hypothetical protein
MGTSIDTALRLPANIDPTADHKEILGLQKSFNLAVAELTAIAVALHSILGLFHNRRITILSSNLLVVFPGYYPG